MSRPGPDEWAFGVAEAVARRGECARRQVGAIIVDREGRLVAAGYNGTYRGGPNCLGGACPRGQHYPVGLGELCECGDPWPCSGSVPPGSSYDTGPGACIAVHAELNALLDVSDRSRLESAELYVTARPCVGCLKILRNTQIYRINYRDDSGATGYLIWPFLEE